MKVSHARRVILVFLLVLAGSMVSVYAASYDGVYNYAYNLHGPSGWETHYVDEGFIVRSGVISSNPPALSGTVDSSGNVHFTGPSPYGSPSATFTGVIYSDGTGKGTYTDSQGLQGAWSVTRVSGGGFDFARLLLDVMNSFAFIGEYFGLTGTTASAVGTAAVITGFVFFVVIVTSVGSSRGSVRRGEYHADQPDMPEREHGISPSTIGVPPPPHSPPAGISVQPPGLPDTINLRARWGRKILLDWKRPNYDKNLYELYGYEIVQLRYDGTSTAPSKVLLDRLSPRSSNWRANVNQSYQWNTQGDVAGYRVDALFLNKQAPYHEFLRIGETTYFPGK